MAYTLVDPQVGFYSPIEDIKAEIDRLEAMEPDEGVTDALKELRSWLEDRND